MKQKKSKNRKPTNKNQRTERSMSSKSKDGAPNPDRVVSAVPDEKSEGTQPQGVEDIERLDLRVALLLKENGALKNQVLESQSQLIEANAKVGKLEIQVQQSKLDRTVQDNQESLQESIKVVQTKYGIDLSKDAINLETGLITRDNTPKAQPEEES